jgi:hypothetical protein
MPSLVVLGSSVSELSWAQILCFAMKKGNGLEKLALHYRAGM